MVFLAFLLAFWEIQIEGKDGWASCYLAGVWKRDDLSSWRVDAR